MRSFFCTILVFLAIAVQAQTSPSPGVTPANIPQDLWFKPVAAFGTAFFKTVDSTKRSGIYSVDVSATTAAAPSYKRVELMLSGVDDSAILSFNGREIQRSSFGTTVPYVDVTNTLVQGENSFRVQVGNEKGGGCGAVVTLRGDQDNNQTRSWEWRKVWSPSEVPCLIEETSFWNYATTPAGFHIVEMKLDRVDDVMYAWVNNSIFHEQLLDSTYLSYAKPWRDISKYIVAGDNYLHVRIENPGGGPCSGQIRVIVDGKEYAPPDWFWKRDWFPSDAGPCFDQRVLLHID
ncbi:MAG: hypothetical protein QOE68_2390 [Thermoanaerobaculia bacterium]|jgi:hypothetical protein|nr:hypothetical protein [Thermoanaerobaculia bacterium]